VFPNGTAVQYGPEQKGPYTFPGRYIQKVVETQEGHLWIATYTNGLFLLDTGNHRFKKLKVELPDGRTSEDIRTLYYEAPDRIWAISTIGIHLFDGQGQLRAHFSYGSKGLGKGIAHCMIQINSGPLWLGSNQGLYRFKEDSKQIDRSVFEQVPSYPEFLSNGLTATPVQFVVDQNGLLWALTRSGSIISYNTSTHHFTELDTKVFPGRFRGNSMELDVEGNFWVSTLKKGIVRYSPQNQEIAVFNHSDGLQGDAYKSKNSNSNDQGELFFGGSFGLSKFVPGNVHKNTREGRLFITEMHILNKPARTVLTEQIDTRMEMVKALSLEAKMSSFSFQFSAVGDILNPNFDYAYRLKGFEDEWIHSAGGRKATYTNIPKGDYVFEVKASSGEGLWDIGPQQVVLTIKPFWWNSPWAYTVYTLLALMTGYALYLWIRMRNRLHREEWEFNKEKELYDLKMDFFTKMSHEIQTPLSLISAPINDMLQRATNKNDATLERRLRLIRNNADRLSRIAHELMAVRNHELGKLAIYPEERDIIKDLKRIVLNFSEQARFKQIHFEQHYFATTFRLHYDPQKIEHVLYNLLSNAFKFTPAGGRISLVLGRNRLQQHL
ncbi:MAG: triple tyrosine motif-containing protein, partial [Bacteroidota bacterium]